MEPFNLDVHMEILSHAFLQTISKCRLLSKDCNTLTYESFFRDLNSQGTKTVSGLFIQFLDHAKLYSRFVSTIGQPVALSLSFLPCRVEIKASKKTGILLCVNDGAPRRHEYYVCKPSTKQYRKLPNPKTRYFTLAIGMVVVKSNPLCYKVVRISKPKFARYDHSTHCNYRTEVFDSKTWSWKRVHGLSLPFDNFMVQKQAILAAGSLYWPTSDDKTILAYHQEDNCCSTFSLPEEIHESRDIKLIEYEGRLGVMCEKGGLIELCIMKNNYVEKGWSKRLKMSYEDVRREDRFARCMGCYGSDVALFSGVYKLIFYNMKKKNIDVVRVGSSIEDLFQLQSDNELVNFYSGRR